jgi:hypothetical protein
MKAQPLLYLETSIFGFYYDEQPANQHRRQAVVSLLRQIHAGQFKAVTSSVTKDELRAAPEPLATRLIELLADVAELELDDDEVEQLAGAYIAEGIVPKKFADDARHVACATIGRAEVLVSLNLKHIANEWSERRINSINLREGYSLLSIRTPEEVIKYED